MTRIKFFGQKLFQRGGQITHWQFKEKDSTYDTQKFSQISTITFLDRVVSWMNIHTHFSYIAKVFAEFTSGRKDKFPQTTF